MSILKFWGVQGSCAGGIYTNDSYGTNTACVSIEHNNNLIIFDSGTGIRKLSHTLDANHYDNIVLFLTHAHWDHIQGFPFFKFLYSLNNLTIFSHSQEHIDSLINQLNGKNFPVNADNLLCKIHSITTIKEFELQFDYSLDHIKTNHPGNCVGYRLKHDDFDITYMPDNQLHSVVDDELLIDKYAKFCHKTDVLIHDTQFTIKDMPNKINWGHSLFTDTLQLAIQAKVNKFVLFHHDPTRQKGDLNSKLDYCKKNSSNLDVIIAKEGQSIRLTGQ